MESSLLTTKQVQELLHIDRTTIYRMLKDGRLLGVKVGHQWRFPAHEVNDLLSGAIRVKQSERPYSVDILPLHCLQPIQDVFAEIAEVGAVTVDENGQPLTRIFNSGDFCKLIYESKQGYKACRQSWQKLVQQTNSSQKYFSCHAGLQYTSAAIEIKGQRVAYFIVGQFLENSPEPEKFAESVQTLAYKYHIDPSKLLEASQGIPIHDNHRVTKINQWIERVSQTFGQISTERADLTSRLQQISEISIVNI